MGKSTVATAVLGPGELERLRQMLRRVLLVEPEAATRAQLQQAAQAVADVDSQARFSTARLRLLSTRFDFLVANLRLGAYNGLHLVHLASAAGVSTRSIVYGHRSDLGLAREARRARAFYETCDCLPVTLPAYLQSALPEQDRRDPAVPDRRTLFRGGRRCWDHHVAGFAR